MERLKILITGATGFVGANLARYFYSEGHDIAVTIRTESNTWRINDVLGNFTLLNTDITDRNKIREDVNSYKPNIIIHNAAFGGYHFETEEKRVFDTNLLGTINMVDAYLQSNSELLINTGSSSEYGIKDNPMKEDNLLEPMGDYAVSKSATTLYCRSKSLENNRKIVTFRLFSAYGYYEESHRLIPYVLRSIMKEQTARLNNPNNVRDFIFIEDICSAYSRLIRMINHIDLGEIINLGSGKTSKVKEIIEIAEKIAGKKLHINWQNSESRNGDRAVNWTADVSKLQNILKWKPQFSLEEGLAKTYYWFKDNIGTYEVMENSKSGKIGK